jgi:hypothetical protein
LPEKETGSMIRRITTLLLASLLALAACGSGSRPTLSAPAPAFSASPAAPAFSASPVAPAFLTSPAASPAGPDLSASPEPALTVSISDPAGPDGLLVDIPLTWVSLTAGQVANPGNFAAWQAAHPEITAASAAAITAEMNTGNVALFAFDAADTVNGFTPNLNITWIDVPATGREVWLAQQAVAIAQDYDLADAPQYQSWSPAGAGVLGGFIGSYRFSLRGLALAGSQMIAPLPDGRAAVLTFSCLDDQTGLFVPALVTIFGSLATRP